jgi:hypothetical protein
MQLRDELQKVGGLSNDPIAVQRISLQQKKIYDEAGVSVLAPLLTPIVQFPITIGLFLGIKKLCDFPLEQLKVGGYGWITDLTVPDPMYVLPLAMVVLINAQLSVSDPFWCTPSSNSLNSTPGWRKGPHQRCWSNPPHVQRVQSRYVRFRSDHG